MRTREITRMTRWAAGAALVLGLSFGCDVDDDRPSPTSLIADREAADDAILMRVDGRPVTLAEAQAHWERHPRLSPEELVEALKRREALVSAGLREGIPVDDPTIELARTRGLARAWLAREIEAKHRPEAMPAEAWEPLLEKARGELVRPAGWEVAMLEIVYPTQTQKGEPVPEEDAAKMREAARIWIEKVAERLGESPSPEAMVTTADSVAKALPPFLRAQAFSSLRFPDDPQADELGEGWVQLDPTLRDSLQGADLEPKRLTEPLPTSAGWSLLLPRERIDEATATEAQLEARARAHAAVEERRVATEEAVERLRARGEWSVDAEALKEAWVEQTETQ